MGSEISAVENVGAGRGAAEKFSVRAKDIQKISPKIFMSIGLPKPAVRGKKGCDHFAIFGFFLIPNPGFRED